MFCVRTRGKKTHSEGVVAYTYTTQVEEEDHAAAGNVLVVVVAGFLFCSAKGPPPCLKKEYKMVSWMLEEHPETIKPFLR